jgi:CHAT domain-containing protein
VLSGQGLAEAQAEVDAMRLLLGAGRPTDDVISALTPLQQLIRSGDFGLLHFACHNRFHPDSGSSITLGNVEFTPTLMTTAASDKVLARTAPTVFMNACRSAGANPAYNELDSWAIKFLRAGAAAFIGSLWDVSDGAARVFAEEFYSRLKSGATLGQAAMDARTVAASQPGDPTWLAYSVYGNSNARIVPAPT